jgi:hypothetical protein
MLMHREFGTPQCATWMQYLLQATNGSWDTQNPRAAAFQVVKFDDKRLEFSLSRTLTKGILEMFVAGRNANATRRVGRIFPVSHIVIVKQVRQSDERINNFAASILGQDQ